MTTNPSGGMNDIITHSSTTYGVCCNKGNYGILSLASHLVVQTF